MDSWVSGLMGAPVAMSDMPGRVVLMGGKEETPWGLTHGQMDVLDAFLEEHTAASVAGRLAVSVFTVNEQMARARKAMGAKNSVEAALMWLSYRRGKGEA